MPDKHFRDMTATPVPGGSGVRGDPVQHRPPADEVLGAAGVRAGGLAQGQGQRVRGAQPGHSYSYGK